MNLISIMKNLPKGREKVFEGLSLVYTKDIHK